MLHAARLAPDDPGVLRDLGHALEHAGRPADAIEVLERALASSDEEARLAILIEVAERRMEVGHVDLAAAELRARAAEVGSEDGGMVGPAGPGAPERRPP